MLRTGIVLATNATGAAAQPSTSGAEYIGGRSALTVVAGNFTGLTCQLQLLGPDNSTWINIGSAITANGVTSFDAPSGVYRLNMSGGTSAGLYATLTTLPYG